MAEPLDPLAAAYLESLAGKAPGTLDAYRRALRHFLAWLQERPGSGVSFDPSTFTRTAVQIYFAELEEQGLSVSDRARRKAALNGFARWLIEEQGLLQRNPMRAVALPAQPLLAPRELSGDQRFILRSLVERDESPRSAALFALGYWAGCRVSDVAWLEHQHAHLSPKAGWIHVGYKGGKARDIDLLKRYHEAAPQQATFAPDELVPLDGVVPARWREIVVQAGEDGVERVNRINYELSVLHTVREKLRCKELWLEGADRFRNPDDDLPADFAEQREANYAALNLSPEAAAFTGQLRAQMEAGLQRLNDTLPANPHVTIIDKGGGWIKLSPLEAQPEPPQLPQLKAAVQQHWSMLNLLDVLKETDLRVLFTQHLRSVTGRDHLDPATLQRRLLLCLYGLGTNIGLKRVGAGEHGESYRDLLYVRRRFISRENLRAAIAAIVNALFAVRKGDIWGDATTACASDSKKFSAWDQNLLTEWSVRHRGPGVMIYWHVERKAACIYSQLKSCTSSEVAAMITGVIRHCTEMSVQKQYVDSHGQSEVAFAFCNLLGFQLLPRLKGIHRQKLYRPQVGQPEAYPNLQLVLTRPIKWELIEQQYDEIVKYVTAVRLGTAEPEAILRRFTRTAVQHPTYQAMAELGKVYKTLFSVSISAASN